MHGHIFCLGLQFRSWHDLLVRVVEEIVEYKRALQPEEPTRGTNTSFAVEVKAMHYVWALGNKNSYSLLKRLLLISVGMYTIHFIQIGFPASKMPRHDYTFVQNVVRTYPGFTNEVENAGHLYLSYLSEVAGGDRL